MSSENVPCIEHAAYGDSLVVTILIDRIRDPDKVDQLKDSMTEIVKQQKCRNLIIDLSRVQIISSIGFLAFLAMRRLPGLENIVLCNLNSYVRELFIVCRLIPYDNSSSAPFHETTSVASALEWCRTKA